MFTASNIHYELAGRVRGLGPGGLGEVHHLARRIGLIAASDQRLHLLKVHLPYHESDHVLNVVYNILLEQLRSGVQALRMPVDNLVSNWA
jgi:hypothetical protein